MADEIGRPKSTEDDGLKLATNRSFHRTHRLSVNNYIRESDSRRALSANKFTSPSLYNSQRDSRLSLSYLGPSPLDLRRESVKHEEQAIQGKIKEFMSNRQPSPPPKSLKQPPITKLMFQNIQETLPSSINTSPPRSRSSSSPITVKIPEEANAVMLSPFRVGYRYVHRSENPTYLRVDQRLMSPELNVEDIFDDIPTANFAKPTWERPTSSVSPKTFVVQQPVPKSPKSPKLFKKRITRHVRGGGERFSTLTMEVMDERLKTPEKNERVLKKTKSVFW